MSGAASGPLGLWAFRSRLSAVHHMGFLGILRFAFRLWRHPVPDDERLAVLIEAG